jgi:hypothetical protein
MAEPQPFSFGDTVRIKLTDGLPSSPIFTDVLGLNGTVEQVERLQVLVQNRSNPEKYEFVFAEPDPKDQQADLTGYVVVSFLHGNTTRTFHCGFTDIELVSRPGSKSLLNRITHRE